MFASNRKCQAQRRQRGGVAIVVGVSLFALVGAAALAVDFGRWWVVRGELQNAADASALAGTGYLFKPAINGKPNWTVATAQGQNAIALNKSENVALQSGTVTPGYWDFATRTFDVNTAKVPTNNDLPALRVSITRTAGQNSGPVLMTLGKAMGVQTIDAAATATAVISVPGSAGAGYMAPIALGSCMLQTATGLWDSANQTPMLDAGGNPIRFVVASGAANTNHCNGCQCGQWTSGPVDNNSAAYTRGLINNGVPSAVDVGSSIWIQPGTQAGLYDDFDTALAGKDIIVPVVSNAALDSKGFTPVQSYACLRVVAGIQGGNVNKVCSEYPSPGGTSLAPYGQVENKCLIVSFSPQPCAVGEANGTSGPFTGTFVPPRLVQ